MVSLQNRIVCGNRIGFSLCNATVSYLPKGMLTMIPYGSQGTSVLIEEANDNEYLPARQKPNNKLFRQTKE